MIGLPVTINLRGPEVGAGRGQPEQMTVVPVPETAMGKQHRAISRKDQIGLARQTAIMKTEPERSEEHTSELQSLMRISYAVFCLKKKKKTKKTQPETTTRTKNESLQTHETQK